MIVVRLLNKFCQFKYYKDIASFMRIKTPVINMDIPILTNTTCIVHGIKKISMVAQVEPPKLLQITTTTTQISSQGPPISLQQPPVQNNPEVKYIFEQNAQQMLEFGQALQISKQLDMDLCLMRNETANSQPILSLSTIRKHIYTQYYSKHIKNGGKQNYKGVRLGQKINANDLRTKVQNVKRLFKIGERKFKLLAINDSEKSQKVLIQFGKIFQKQIEPYIQSFKNQNRKSQDRWVAILQFDEQIEIDFQKVNKKWRRKVFQEQQQKVDRSEEEMANFSDQKIEIQREMYITYKQLNMKMPPKYEAISKLQNELQNDKLAIYKSVLQNGDQFEQSQDWDQEQKLLFKQKMQKFNQQHFKQRSVSQILDEMEQLKKHGYESQAYQVARFKKLKQELDSKIKQQNNDH